MNSYFVIFFFLSWEFYLCVFVDLIEMISADVNQEKTFVIFFFDSLKFVAFINKYHVECVYAYI